MNARWYSLLGAGTMLLVAACSPPKPVSVAEPTPVPTPHPAQGAREAAIRLYPDLAKPDSTFSKTFLEVFEAQKASNPRSLTAVDWPLTVARRTGSILGVAPLDPNAPPPPAATPKPRE